MNMSSGYGRSQRYMHPTNIEQEVRCLGLHEQIIEVGDENNLLLQEGVDVPLCINTQNCVSTNFIQYDQLQLKDNTKAQLLGNLKSSGVDISVVNGKRVGEMQDISRKKRYL